MNSQQLLYINIGLGILIVLYFFFGRGATKKPTRLNLKNPDSPQSEAPQKIFLELQKTSVESATKKIASKMSVLEPEAESKASFKESEAPQQKNLAIFFMYNGHDWEAYNVLGLAQGANMKQVTAAYQDLLKKSDPQSFPFYEAAYNSVLTKKRRDVL